ncbi:MAG: hypothetical protein AAGF11_31185 [Myxococcota bacterium]
MKNSRRSTLGSIHWRASQSVVAVLLALPLVAAACGGDDGDDMVDGGDPSEGSTAPGTTGPSSAGGTEQGLTTEGATSGGSEGSETSEPGDSSSSMGPDEGSTDSGTTSAGSSGDEPLPVDACTNEADMAILDAVDEDMIAGDCALQSGGNTQSAIMCIQEVTGLSDDCTTCFGLVISCVFAECLPQCFEPSAAECVECRADNCDADFVECSGIES